MTAQRVEAQWRDVCSVDDIAIERGVAALLDDVQVAIFRTFDGALFAVGNRDPFSGANVIARGIVGSVGSGPDQRDTVASPMYKHVFDLATGACLTDPSRRLPVYRTWIAGGVVYVHPVPLAPPPAD